MDTAQLLREMGIDVWRARRRAAVAAAVEEATAADAVGSMAGRAPTSRPGPAVGTAAPTVPAGSTASRQPHPPFAVICAANDAALLLAGVGDLRTARRFALDVLNAIGGGPVRSLLFEWPQTGLDPDAGSAARALRAFATRQLDEAGAPVVVVSSDVLDRLGDRVVAEDAVVVRPLEELMTDGGLKRQLWESLKRRSTA